MTLNSNLAVSLPGPVGFVLGGGGSLGAIQVGMLQALAEQQVTAGVVTGTSIGAINGAIVAADPIRAANRLSHIWNSLDSDRVLGRGLARRAYTLIRNRTHVYNSRGLLELVEQTIGDRQIGDLELPYAAVALDIETAEPVAFHDGPVASAVMASSAIPGVFPPVVRNGRAFYDGGLAANVPVDAAIRLGANSLVVLDCAFADQQLETPDSLAAAALYSSTVAMRQQVSRDLPAAAEVMPVVYLPGPRPQAISPLDFSRTTELIAESYEVARAFLETLVVDGSGLYRASGAAADPSIPLNTAGPTIKV